VESSEVPQPLAWAAVPSNAVLAAQFRLCAGVWHLVAAATATATWTRLSDPGNVGVLITFLIVSIAPGRVIP
jgi:hypothetical protein